MCASDSEKSSSRGTVESNAPLDVPIVMPEHADGSSESKDTEDNTRFELHQEFDTLLNQTFSTCLPRKHSKTHLSKRA